MNESELKQNIARNITSLRKQNNMTQAELAAQLCYSDKSVSKWERGDGLPDVYVLTRIADLFCVTVNDIISGSADEQIVLPQKDDATSRHVLVTVLSAGIVWFVAALVFVILKLVLPGAGWLWMTFVCAIPVSAIVFVVFAHIWWGNVLRCVSVSILVWGIVITVDLIMIILKLENNKIIYLAAGVFQVLVVLWYVYQNARKKVREAGSQQQDPLTGNEQAAPCEEGENDNDKENT